MFHPTSPTFMSELELAYKDQVITPCQNAEKVMTILKNKFAMYRITDLKKLDAMTLENIKWTPIDNSEDTEIYGIEKNENSRRFYEYFYERFGKGIFQPLLCILYDKKAEKIKSNNCVLMDSYITILYGIDPQDIEEKTEKYKSYLNTIYLYYDSQGK